MLCVALTTADTWLGSFIIARATPYMISDLAYGAYFFFAAILVCMGIWAFFFVPETKGVSLRRPVLASLTVDQESRSRRWTRSS